MRLVTASDMRALERHAFDRGNSPATLMETAGTGVAQVTADWLGKVQGRRLLTLAGTGANGGDAIIASRILATEHGARPCLFLIADRGNDPLLEWAAKGAVPLVTFDAPGAARETVLDTLRRWLVEADVVLDGILGIGGRLPLQGDIANVLQLCREISPPGQRRVAVDVPTGVQADTGQVDAWAFRAQLTIATGPAKPGLFIHPGAEHAGRVKSVDIGVPLGDDPAPLWRMEATEVARALPARPDNSHKGTYGKVLVVAASGRYVGAAYLAGAGAVRAGAGLVTLALPGAAQGALAGRSMETTYLPLPDDPAAPGALTPAHGHLILEAAAGYDAVALGPGMGAHPATHRLVLDLCAGLAGGAASPPVVIDADGLNALAQEETWPRPDTPRWVLTPHPGEMSRLRRRSAREVQGDRLTMARESAREWGQVVVLKGAPSIIASPDGRACLNAFANAALGTAGSGDVLTGTIAGLLAQGIVPFVAASAGSYVHALAAELWRARHGASGLAVAHLVELLPDAQRHLRALA